MRKKYLRSGAWMRDFRINKKKLTQKEFAADLNVHIQYVSNWERGICLPPTESLKIIMAKLKAPVREVFFLAYAEDALNTFKSEILGK